MTIALALLLLLAAAAFIGRPFLSGPPPHPIRPASGAHGRDELLAEKEHVYAAIKDLDFEYHTGKLSDEDYRELRERCRVRALRILDALGSDATQRSAADPAVATHEAGAGMDRGPRCAACGHVNPEASNFCESCGTPIDSPARCRVCGAAAQPSDRFCAGCGTPRHEANEPPAIDVRGAEAPP